MRELLQSVEGIAFPQVLHAGELDNHRFILMEKVTGDNLDTLWQQDIERANHEMHRLGEMLARLHKIPLARAKPLLPSEETLYSEQYLAWMMETIAPYFPAEKTSARLIECCEIVTQRGLEMVVTHGDFGPHQVIVDEQGRWVLLDFEYAVISPFADDLADTEVRLEIGSFLGSSLDNGQLFNRFRRASTLVEKPVQPSDTKCDMFIRPPDNNVVDFTQQMKSNEAITIVSEDEIVLQSGQLGTRLEVESQGRSLSLIAEVNERVVVLTCYGELAPFDEIAVTLHGMSKYFKISGESVLNKFKDSNRISQKNFPVPPIPMKNFSISL